MTNFEEEPLDAEQEQFASQLDQWKPQPLSEPFTQRLQKSHAQIVETKSPVISNSVISKPVKATASSGRMITALIFVCLMMVGFLMLLQTSPQTSPRKEAGLEKQIVAKINVPSVVDPPPTLTVLNSGWKIRPIGKPLFRVINTNHIELLRGELEVRSVLGKRAMKKRKPLRISTPLGTATTTGTHFFIGTHCDFDSPNSEFAVATTNSNDRCEQLFDQPVERDNNFCFSPSGADVAPLHTPESHTLKRKKAVMKKMNSLTRVLVLAGIVTLSNTFGSVTGKANSLLAAEKEQSPVKAVVKANSDFAIDLYREMIKDDPKKNLFFSPYSVSTALGMTIEGATGKTALEMGSVLRYPQAARQIGNDAQTIPWRTALMHSGYQQLEKQFNSRLDEKSPKVKTLRKEIAELQRQLATIKLKIKKAARNSQKKLRADEKKIIKSLNAKLKQIDQCVLRVANSLWGEKTYPFNPGYLKTIGKHYATGGAFPVDFLNNADAERQRINKWVEEKTEGRIADLIPKGGIDDETRLVLVNAIYFKGNWAKPFEASETKTKPFLLADGKKSTAQLMDQWNDFRYAAFNADGSFFKTPQKVSPRQDGKIGVCYPKNDGFSLIELPYNGDKLSMVVIAPRSHNGLPAIERQLTSEKLTAWIKRAKKYEEVNVKLPKFKMTISTTLGDSCDKKSILRRMGMNLAFDGKKAQFNNMMRNPDRPLYISKVLHKAFIEVNEKGTEAAAATVVLMRRGKSMPRTVPFSPVFKADRPFLYLIRDIKTGSILFMGRMVDPAAK